MGEMDSRDNLGRLVSLVDEFEKLDAAIHDGVTIDQAIAKKVEIKSFLAGCGPLNVGSELSAKLKNIRDNHGYRVDWILPLLDPMGEVSQEIGEVDPIENLYEGECTMQYVDESFFRRKNEASTLIIGESPPPNILTHFSNLRECYALGLFDATLIYCRSLIETAAFVALCRRGRVKLDPKIIDPREYSLNRLLKSIANLISKTSWDNADKLITKANELLHSKRGTVDVNEKEAYQAIKDTFTVLEQLFSGTRARW